VKEPGKDPVVVRTFEMSEGGMSVYSAETLPLGTPLIVEASLAGGARPIKVPAVVRNVRGFRCGLEFPEIAEAERNEIARYLSALTDVIEI
jgi:c-di-GMP-binding flagellar brake protein YcgR